MSQSIWKDQIRRSQYLKDWYKNKPEKADHSVFGQKNEQVFLKCQNCGQEFSGFDMVKSIKNGEIEYILCKKCFAKRCQKN